MINSYIYNKKVGALEKETYYVVLYYLLWMIFKKLRV